MSVLDPLGMRKRKIRIEKPEAQADLKRNELWEEVQYYANLVPFEPDPNLGRVYEIKQEIKKGTYLSKDVLDATADRLARRFLRKL